jgi:hypothetical protein
MWVKPSPQMARVQSDLQALELPLLGPSSQASPACLKPSPHLGNRQARVHWPRLLLLVAEVALLAGLLEAVAAGGELADVGAAVEVAAVAVVAGLAGADEAVAADLLGAVELAAAGVGVGGRCRTARRRPG